MPSLPASARIDEAIESMVPDQFEILLYKKNSEYANLFWHHLLVEGVSKLLYRFCLSINFPLAPHPAFNIE